MAQVTWTIRGRLRLQPHHDEIADAFGNPVDLAGVRVKVSARQSSLDITGWEKWGEAVTDRDGNFTIAKKKNETDRRFKVEVLFKDNQLLIYGNNDNFAEQFGELVTSVIPTGVDDWLFDATTDSIEFILEQSSRLAHDVKWLTVHEDTTKRSGPSIGLGSLTFGPHQRFDLGQPDPMAHAEIWFLAKKYIAHINQEVEGFRRDVPIAVRYPHENSVIGDRREASYANMINNCCYLVKNKLIDGFNIETLYHEMEHLKIYQLTRGETALAAALIRNGSTHEGRLSDTFIGCHEALAEVISNEVYRQMFSNRGTVYGRMDAERRPFSRPYLRSRGINTLAAMSYHEDGWISALSMLLCPDAQGLDMDAPGPYSDDPTPGSRREVTGITLGELFAVLAHDGNRADDGMHISDMDIPRFYAEVAHVVGHFSQDMADRYLEVIDPTETRSAYAILVGSPMSRPATGRKIKPMDASGISNPSTHGIHRHTFQE